MSLQSIYISGFKSIRELDFELRPLNVLIGANGSGKSNFMSFFRLLMEMSENRLDSYSARVGASALLHFGPKVTEAIHFRVRGDRVEYKAVLVPNQQGGLQVQENELRYLDDDGALRWAIVNDVPDREALLLSYRGVKNKTPQGTRVDDDNERGNSFRDAVRTLRVYHFQDTTPEARIKQTHRIHDNAYLRYDGENLAAYLYFLRERFPAYYARIVAQIRQVAPFFEDFELRSNPLDPNTIRLEWREKGSDAYLDAHMLSDGTLRFMCLAALLMQPEDLLPRVILVDEPELGLHPYAILQFASMARSVSALRPVVIATQSVTLVNQFAPEDIVVVDRRNGQSEFQRLESDRLTDWLAEYGLGELWEKNVFGGRPQLWEPHP